jgi:hypothetical protein
MSDEEVLRYLRQKNDLVNDDFKLKFLFNLRCFREKKFYKENCTKLDLKMEEYKGGMYPHKLRRFLTQARGTNRHREERIECKYLNFYKICQLY